MADINLDDLDLSPATPEPAQVDVDLDSLDLAPAADPVDRAATRKLRDSFVRLDEESLRTGGPVVDIRGDFAPQSFQPGTRNFLASWSKGLLDLPDTAFTRAQEDTSAAREYASLVARRPNLGRLVAETPELQAPLLSHLRALVRLRDTPASPREVLDAGDAATQDWLKAAAAGTLTKNGERLEVPVEAIDPAAVRDLWSKVQALPIAEAEDSLSKSDRALYDALGGAHWLQFQKSRKPYYIGLSRREKLLGQPLRDPSQTPTIQASIFGGDGSVPTTSPLAFEDFERISSFAQTLFGTAQQAGVAQAQALTDRRASLTHRFPGSVLGPDLSSGLLSLTGADTEQPGGGFGTLGRRAGFGVASTVAGAADFLNSKVAPALNVLTLGHLNGVLEDVSKISQGISGLYSLTDNLVQGKYDAAVDPDFLAKKTQQSVFMMGRALALGAPEGHDDRKAASELEFIENSFPDLDSDTLRELRQSYFGGSQFVTGAMRRASEGSLGAPLSLFSKVFRTDSPYLQRVAGENIGPLLESPEGLAFTLLGSSQLYSSVFRRSRLREFYDPKREGAITPLERHLAETGQFSQVPSAIRAGLLDEINARISEIPDAAAAGQFVSRVGRALKDHDAPLTPGLKAKIDTAAARFKDQAESLQGRALSDADKAALLDLAEPVSDLPPIDQQFAISGRDAFVATEGSALKVSRLKKWYETQVRSLEELDLPRQVDRSPEKMVEVQHGLIEHAAREREFVGRQSRLLDVTNTLVEDLAAKAQELQKSAAAHGALHTSAVASWNSYLRAATKRNVDIETAGATVSRPNPRIREPVFERLTTAVLDGGPKLEALLTDRDLATPARAAVQEALKTATDREAVLKAWARVEIRDRSAPTLSEFRATEKTAGIAEAIAKAIDEAEAKGESVVLTQAQKNWLDRHSAARGERLFKAHKAAADDALRATVEEANKAADKTLSLAEAIRDLQSQARSATVDSPKLKLPKKLRTAIVKALEEFDIPVAKRYVPLAADATDLELSALQAFKESVDDLSAEHHALVNGVNRLSSLEMAALSKSAPHAIRHELAWHDRAAEGALHWNRYISQKLNHLLGRAATKAERQAIFAAMKSGRPQTKEAAILMQDQRLRLLSDAMKAGVITPERYAEMVGTPYAHNLFDRATQAELANTLNVRRRSTPSGYTALAVDPAALKFRIPENGAEYVAWRDERGAMHSKDGFDTPESAAAWVQENLPPGTEVSIAKTWPLVEKALSGLVEDAGLSHLDMAESLTLATHNARLGQFMAATPHVKRASDVADLVARGEGILNDTGSVFEAKSGERFLKWTNPKNPWLEGRFVSVEAVKWLEEFKTGYGFVRELTQAASDLHPVQGDLLGPAWKALDFLRTASSRTLRTAGNLFAIKNIALSPGTVVKNWISNVLTARWAGLNLFNPIEFFHGIRHAAEGVRSRRLPELDPYWQDLAEADIVRFGNEADYHNTGPGAKHSRHLEAELEKSWRSLEGLHARRARLQDRIDSGVFPQGDEGPGVLDKAEAELLRLDNEIRAASTLASRTGFRSLLGHGINLSGDFYDAVIKGDGKLHNALWNNFYAEVTGDRLIKYMTYRYLRDNLHLPKEAALHRVADFMQQLHRVPATAREIGRTIGGAMFTAFPVDQARILANVVRQDPMALPRMALLLSGWNSVAIASTGNSPEDYLESWALQHGVQRDGISDSQALLGGMIIPGGFGSSTAPGGLFSVSLGPGIWEIFQPQSRAGRSASALAKGDSTSAARGLVADAFLGGLSKFVGADLYTMLAAGLIEKVDERGDPMKDTGDVAQWLARTLLIPRGAPGSREGGVLSRAFSDQEINLESGRRVSFTQAVGDLFLQVKPEFDTPSRFRSALMSQIRAHAGGLTAFRRAERQDDQLATLLARGATRADGSLDEEKAGPIIRQYHLDNPTHYIRPDGVKVVESFDEADIGRALDEYGKPKTIRTFRRQPLPLQISTYATWRAVDSLAPQRDPEWYQQIRSLLLQKLTADRRFPVETIQDVNTRIEEALNSGRLPPDAVEDLRTFQALAARRVARS